MTKTEPLPHVSKPRHTLPHVKTDQGTSCPTSQMDQDIIVGDAQGS